MWKPFTPQQKYFFFTYGSPHRSNSKCAHFLRWHHEPLALMVNAMIWWHCSRQVWFKSQERKKSLTKNHRGIAPWASWVHCLKLETIRMVDKKQANTAWNSSSLKVSFIPNEFIIDCCSKFATGLKCSIRHRSKSIWVTSLFFCQNDPPMS